MKFIADLHIHSHFSIATSKQLVPEYLDFWAALKGIKVVGTGDFTHPGWTKELKEKLVPTGTGLYNLNNKLRLDLPFLPDAEFDRDVSFILSAEISTIYKKNGKVRKVHHVILAPDFETAEGIQAELAKREFNITSDGRPILGLDSRDLLELVLSVSEHILFIPAHIWTPWFSVLGSKSGFDTVQECYGDLSKYIYAVETGLSADAPMLWINSTLDSYTLLSNSDAHSPERLGRNSNILDTDVSYTGIVDAVKKGDGTTFKGTIDLFPQEGKYHFDGHRKCGIRWSPLESLKHNGICTECGKPVTEGVLNRAAQLADRESYELRDKRLPYTSIIPLKEVLSEIHGIGGNSKFIAREYFNLLKKLGPELKILLEVPPEEIEEKAGALLSEAVFRMRSKRVFIQEGFDGEYGKISVFSDKEILSVKNKDQESLFAVGEPSWLRPHVREPIPFDLAEFNRLKHKDNKEPAAKELQKTVKEKNPLSGLNSQQKRAVTRGQGQCMVIAGPGTGKTRVLTQRIGYLVRDLQIDPSAIFAVTFTNKAAVEMKSRIRSFIPSAQADLITVATFHAFGYTVLKEFAEYISRQDNFSVIHRHETESIIAEITGESKTKVRSLSDSVSNIKQGIGDGADNDVREIFDKYENYLNKENLLDLDDLIYKTNKILSENEQVLSRVRDHYKWILIDEFQDINRMQYDLILKIAGGEDSNIFVIGDPNQAIYGFRGADVKFIDHFKRDFPRAEVIRLHKSYRCPDIVLKASSSVTGGDETLSGIDHGGKIKVSVHQTEKSEAEFIARTIEQLAGGLRFFSMDSDITQGSERDTVPLSECAVLCRTAKQFPALKKAFKDHSIPCRVAGENSFFMTEPVLSVVYLLRFVLNPASKFLMSHFSKNKFIKIEPSTSGLNLKYQDMPVEELLKNLADKYINPNEENEESVSRLFSISERFGKSHEDFLRFALTGSSADDLLLDSEKVTLMTLHASKGLEFECVIIAGCEKGLIPYSLFPGQESDPEEEKRLFYVGMTRTKKRLYLTMAKNRLLFGRVFSLEKSPFVSLIDSDFTEQEIISYKKKPSKDKDQLKLF